MEESLWEEATFKLNIEGSVGLRFTERWDRDDPGKEEGEEGKQYFWVIHYSGVKQKSLLIKFPLLLPLGSGPRYARGLDFRALLHEESLNAHPVWWDAWTVRGLLRLRPDEASIGSPFQSHAQVHRLGRLVKWPALLAVVISLPSYAGAVPSNFKG